MVYISQMKERAISSKPSEYAASAYIIDASDMPISAPIETSPYVINLRTDDASVSKSDYMDFYESLLLEPTQAKTNFDLTSARSAGRKALLVGLAVLKVVGTAAIILASLAGIITALLMLRQMIMAGDFAGFF